MNHPEPVVARGLMRRSIYLYIYSIYIYVYIYIYIYILNIYFDSNLAIAAKVKS